MPVIEYYTQQAKVAEIDSSASVDEVYEKSRKVVYALFPGEVSNVTI